MIDVQLYYFRPKGTLPYWCAYIAWVVTALCIVVCVFFAILYSLQFDKGKSEAWLFAFFFSFVQSVVLLQPLKVLSNLSNQLPMFLCCQKYLAFTVEVSHVMLIYFR